MIIDFARFSFISLCMERSRALCLLYKDHGLRRTAWTSSHCFLIAWQGLLFSFCFLLAIKIIRLLYVFFNDFLQKNVRRGIINKNNRKRQGHCGLEGIGEKVNRTNLKNGETRWIQTDPTVLGYYCIVDATGFEPPWAFKTLEKKGVSGTSSSLFSNLFSKSVYRKFGRIAEESVNPFTEWHLPSASGGLQNGWKEKDAPKVERRYFNAKWLKYLLITNMIEEL